MLGQIVLAAVLLVAVYVVSFYAVAELGGEETGKLSFGIAEMILGFVAFFIIGEDETVLGLKDDVQFLYYLLRYAFLFDGLYGIGQISIVVIKRIDGSAETLENVYERNTTNNQRRSAGVPSGTNCTTAGGGVQGQGQQQEYVPAWKRIQMEQESK